jgi:hypothetical protein
VIGKINDKHWSGIITFRDENRFFLKMSG